MSPPHDTYIYPFTPFVDFDFVYRFPFGAYPYSGYGYPEYPYRFIFPPPGCVTTELETHGSVRIDIPQREATVLVDGFYVGVVDDFDGPFEPLKLTPGAHHIELQAPGFETTVFDVNIEVGHLIVYRTPMRSGGAVPPGGAHALGWNSAIPPELIQVTVRDGWVALNGTVVPWQYQQHQKAASENPSGSCAE